MEDGDPKTASVLLVLAKMGKFKDASNLVKPSQTSDPHATETFDGVRG